MSFNSDKSEIVFFDLETSVPTRPGQAFAILEFGSILVCPRKLIELQHFSTLVRPADLSLISNLSVRCNGITKDAVISAPTFADIADQVYHILHGRIWAGHNILRFDCVRIREAFAEINRPAPEPKGTIDSLALLTQRFGRRAGDMKLATLATYFGLGQQTHRSLDDVRMNLEVLRNCAAVLFLESSHPEISRPSISAVLAPFYRGTQKIQILHNNIPLQACCTRLRVRFGISMKYVDSAGRPRLSFVVDAPPSLCQILDTADAHAQKLSIDSGSGSEWRPVVTRKPGFINFPTTRLNLPTVSDNNTVRWITDVYQTSSSPSSSSTIEEKIVFNNRYDVTELDSLLTPGKFVDAYVSLDTYDYQQGAGIRIVAKKLVVQQPFGLPCISIVSGDLSS